MRDILEIVLNNLELSLEFWLREQLEAAVAELRDGAKVKLDRLQVSEAERIVKQDPESAFKFQANKTAILSVNGNSWNAGNFEVLSISELKARAQQVMSDGAKGLARLVVFDGASTVTDIGALQGSCRETMYQVASQFNCLESPGSYVTEVYRYFNDYTQGPRASISAFPATLLRHYRAPSSAGRFVQETDGAQIDLLAAACGEYVCKNGYFSGERNSDPARIAAALEKNFEQIQLGVHGDIQVLRGANWDGPVDLNDHRTISQAFTSTVSGGGYGGEANLGEQFLPVCRTLLRAAYLGTLLAALYHGRQRVVLTLIGGGAFGNPLDLIWESIIWAFDEVRPFVSKPLNVVVNGRNLSDGVSLEEVVLPDVRKRSGCVLRFAGSVLDAVLY